MKVQTNDAVHRANPRPLTGELEKVSQPYFEDDALLAEERYLATRMECGSCGLVLKDINEIHHAGLDPHFTRTESTDLHEWMEPDYYPDYQNM